MKVEKTGRAVGQQCKSGLKRRILEYLAVSQFSAKRMFSLFYGFLVKLSLN